jgi:hypothetical protein
MPGPERDRVAAELKAKYEAGASIRALAGETARSYGGVHRLLADGGVGLPLAWWRDVHGEGVVIPLPPHRTNGGVLLGAAGPEDAGPFGPWGGADTEADLERPGGGIGRTSSRRRARPVPPTRPE